MTGENKERVVKVLYITSMGRSGSTILDNILDQIPDFCSVGELVYVWERNFIENRKCGCGEPFDECNFWRAAVERAFGGMSEVDAEELVRLRDSGARTRHLPLLLSRHGREVVAFRLSRYIGMLGRLYRALAAETGSRVIVDSSKLPSYGRVLEMVPGIEPYVVHLVRDSRAVAYSWTRSKFQPDTGSAMERYGSFKSAATWNVWNLAAEAFWGWKSGSYLRIRYEDLIDDPHQSLGYILDLVREPALDTSFIEDHTVQLAENHTVGGNPSRFKTGAIKLQLDEEWKTKMSCFDKRIITALTCPVLKRYEYEAGYTQAAGRSNV